MAGRANADEMAASLQELGTMQSTAAELRGRILDVDSGLSRVGKAYLHHLTDWQEHSSITTSLTQSVQVLLPLCSVASLHSGQCNPVFFTSMQAPLCMQHVACNPAAPRPVAALSHTSLSLGNMLVSHKHSVSFAVMANPGSNAIQAGTMFSVDSRDRHSAAPCRLFHTQQKCFRPAHPSANASWMGSCPKHSRCWKEQTGSGTQPANQLRTSAGAALSPSAFLKLCTSLLHQRTFKISPVCHRHFTAAAAQHL